MAQIFPSNVKNLDELTGNRRYPSSREWNESSIYRWFIGTWVLASSFLAIRGTVRINEALGAPVYTCLFHYFGKDGSKSPKKSPFRSHLTNTEHFSHHFQSTGMFSSWSHTDTCMGDQGRVSSPPQNPSWAHWNRSSTCIYWTTSAKHWLRDIAGFVSWNGLESPQHNLLLYSTVSYPIPRAAEPPGCCLSPARQGCLTNPHGVCLSTDGRRKEKWSIFALHPTLPRGFWQISLHIWQSLVCPWLKLSSSLTSAVTTIQGMETNARRDRKWGKRSQGLRSESNFPLFTKWKHLNSLIWF